MMLTGEKQGSRVKFAFIIEEITGTRAAGNVKPCI